MLSETEQGEDSIINFYKLTPSHRKSMKKRRTARKMEIHGNPKKLWNRKTRKYLRSLLYAQSISHVFVVYSEPIKIVWR